LQEKEKKLEMGGQAVIEGVMMRSPRGYSIAVRKKDKSIKIKTIPYTPLTKRIKALGIPFIRGVITLFEMLIIGLKGLDYSVNEWEGDYYEDKKGKNKETENPDSGNPKEEKSPPKEQKQITRVAMAGMMIFSLGVALVMTVVIPNLLTHFVGWIFSLFGGATQGAEGGSRLVESRSPLLYNLVSGFFRACILIAYIWVISLSKNIRRVFEYHGAEHMAVFAFEDNKPLTLENVRPYTTRHPRCGTTFLGVVIIISIIIFAFIAKLIVMIYPPFMEMQLILRKLIIIAFHIVCMPLVAGISYEIIKYGSRHLQNPLTRLLTMPGLLSQYLTTKKPDDEQLQVSIASLNAALSIDAEQKEPRLTILLPDDAPN